MVAGGLVRGGAVAGGEVRGVDRDVVDVVLVVVAGGPGVGRGAPNLSSNEVNPRSICASIVSSARSKGGHDPRSNVDALPTVYVTATLPSPV